MTAVHKFFDVSKGNHTQSKTPELPRNDYFFDRSERKMIKINFDEILYVELLSDYVQLHLQAKTIITRETISNIETKLPVDRFLRTHRSFIVSLDHISSYTNEYVEVASKAISISRSYKEQVLKKLEDN